MKILGYIIWAACWISWVNMAVSIWLNPSDRIGLKVAVIAVTGLISYLVSHHMIWKEIKKLS